MTERTRLPLRIVLYLLLLAAIFGPWLAWETDRNMVRRWLYPAKGQLVALTTRCDAGAPAWLAASTRRLARGMDSPANQLAYVDAQGNIHACHNGWQGLPLASPRVDDGTPFRLASLSKIVAFIGLTAQPPAQTAQWLDTRLVDDLGLHANLADARVADIRIRDLLQHSAGFDRLQAEDSMVIRDTPPWCPAQPQQLAHTELQFTPGSRHAYANLGFCLAEVAHARHFGRDLWQVLETDLRMGDDGLAALADVDSPVQYNFMHQAFYDPGFTRHFDWQALRSSMGLTGNARGLARFIHRHRDRLALSRSMHDAAIACDETRPLSCFDGFLERKRVDGRLLWTQGGYLYGMSARFLLVPDGQMLIWLGAGDSVPRTLARDFLQQQLLANSGLGEGEQPPGNGPAQPAPAAARVVR